MNTRTEKTQDTLPTQLAKEGLRISELPLKKLLTARAGLVKSLYAAPMSEAAFNRARAEEEMIKAVASYNVSVEALLQAQAEETQALREKLQEYSQLEEAAKAKARARLKLQALGLVASLRLAHQKEEKA